MFAVGTHFKINYSLFTFLMTCVVCCLATIAFFRLNRDIHPVQDIPDEDARARYQAAKSLSMWVMILSGVLVLLFAYMLLRKWDKPLAAYEEEEQNGGSAVRFSGAMEKCSEKCAGTEEIKVSHDDDEETALSDSDE